MRRAGVALIIGTMAAAASLTACGGSGSDSGSGPSGSTQGPGTEGANEVPKTIEGQLAATFPKPKVQQTDLPGAKGAIAAGRKACKGKTPIEVREEFISAAESSGVMGEGQEKMIAELDKFEKQSRHSVNFAAGQLAAGVYEATLPEKLRNAGYRGCVYELALQLRREIAKEKKKKKQG
jgi:hypothetical protein